MYLLPLHLLALSVSLVAAGPHWSLSEDPYAFPKYRVSFLNGLPVSNDTAQGWLDYGLKGGEREFLDQPWEIQDPISESGLKSIGGSESETSDPLQQPLNQSSSQRYQLQRMKLDPKSSYICLIPPPVESHVKPVQEPSNEATAAQSFSLLQPLSGTCIYHRQGWFTYKYCHNNLVRQFREMPHAHPHHAGYVPEEDTQFDGFTLGQSPISGNEGQELTLAQQEALVNNVEVVRTAGHRYLVQKWGDGTICDMTGKPRDIEVQFHCSQAMTDSIFFVKETSTCHYIMVIHTPRLCGEPGFKTRLQQREEAPIRCREVLSPEDYAAAYDPDQAVAAQQAESAYPLPVRQNMAKRRAALGIPPPPEAKEQPPPAQQQQVVIGGKKKEEILAAFEALLGGRLPLAKQNQNQNGNRQGNENNRPLDHQQQQQQVEAHERVADPSVVQGEDRSVVDGADHSTDFEIDEAFNVAIGDGEDGDFLIDIKLGNWGDAEEIFAQIDTLIQKAEQKLQDLVDAEERATSNLKHKDEDGGVNVDTASSDDSDTSPSKESEKRRDGSQKHVEL